MIDTKDLYWLAGLLEGEGCFDMTGGRYPRVVVMMCDLDVVERANKLLRPVVLLKERLPARIQRQPDRLPIYRISLSGGRAAGWMMTLYPFMGQRRQKRIREVLSVWRSAPSLRRPYGLKAA